MKCKTAYRIFFTALILLSFLTGQALAGEASPPSTIKICGWISNSFEHGLLLSAIEDFQKSHPRTRVVYEPLLSGPTGTAYMAELMTKFEKGEGPDVFYVSSERIDQIVARDLALPLDDLMKNCSFDTGDFLDNLTGSFRKNGSTYGIPKDFNTFVLFCNTGLFKEAGIALPDSSWDQKKLLDAAISLTNEKKGQAGLCFERKNAYPLVLFGLQNGARYVDEKGDLLPLNSPPLVEALRFYGDLRTKYRCLAFPEALKTHLPGEAFGKGKTAMIVEGGWLIPYLDAAFPGISYSTSLLPSGSAGRTDLILTVGYCISRDCKDPENAWKLIEYLTSRDFQKKIVKKGFALPTRKSVLDDPSVVKHPALKNILRASECAIIQNFGRASTKILDSLSGAQEEVLTGRMTPEEALSQSDRELREWLRILDN